MLLRAETPFRPYVSANVGGSAILCKQSVPRAERPSYASLPIAFPSVATAHKKQKRSNVGGDAIPEQARLPIAFPSVATAHRQRIRDRCHAGKRDLLHWRIGSRCVGGDAILCKQSVPSAERPSRLAYP